MSWYWIIYFLNIIPKIGSVLFVAGIVFLALSLLLYIWYAQPKEYEEEPDPPAFTKTYKKKFYIGIFCLLLAIFTPTKSDIINIAGAGTVLEYVEKDSSLQQIPYELSSYLKEQIQDLRKEINETEK